MFTKTINTIEWDHTTNQSMTVTKKVSTLPDLEEREMTAVMGGFALLALPWLAAGIMLLPFLWMKVLGLHPDLYSSWLVYQTHGKNANTYISEPVLLYSLTVVSLFTFYQLCELSNFAFQTFKKELSS